MITYLGQASYLTVRSSLQTITRDHESVLCIQYHALALLHSTYECGSRPRRHCNVQTLTAVIELRDQRQLHFISSTAGKAEHEWRRWGVPSQQVHPEKVSTTFYSALPSWCVSDPHLLRSASRGMPLVLPLAGICAIVPSVQRI